uniref:RING-type domain-containing protein n=1 Tax=Anopheles dirus TaxID=7168 RepID=A0A182NWV0_9DIPT
MSVQPVALECTICLEKIETDAKFLLCLHSFHRSCIDNWLHVENICPLCRTEEADGENTSFGPEPSSNSSKSCAIHQQRDETYDSDTDTWETVTESDAFPEPEHGVDAFQYSDDRKAPPSSRVPPLPAQATEEQQQPLSPQLNMPKHCPKRDERLPSPAGDERSR